LRGIIARQQHEEQRDEREEDERRRAFASRDERREVRPLAELEEEAPREDEEQGKSFDTLRAI
jgi:hypothetical protein